MHQEPTVEQIYQKKTQLEHILLRPDSYVGSIEVTQANFWILPEGQKKFIQKNIEYVPGLYKIFDEILVNAADNYQRDHSMNTIKVTIDKEKNLISIWNNGNGIPVQIHKEHDIFVPELIFGHLLTSSNYDDTQKKVTGGRNGYGAKLTNIFSKKFSVETADSKNRKLFKMTWTNNMSANTPADTKFYGGEDFTCISFEPDLKRFGMSILSDDMIGLMRKRVYDLAGVISSSVIVYLNGTKVPVKGFSQYVDMYLKSSEDQEVLKIQDKASKSERWELIVSASEGQFHQISFVNSICTLRGGTHVNYIVDQIVEKIAETIKKKHKDMTAKPFQIKNHISIFLKCLIENPAFDSQTKETLTTKASQFGSKYELSEKMIKDILKSPIIDNIVTQVKAKDQAKLAKTLQGGKKSRLLGIPKLEDANDAGTRYAEYCTLILTEGDSAKQLAMAGIEVVGRDRFGVFPLRGKLLNVRDASTKQILDNQEIQNLIKILGLQVGKTYESTKQLRYGSMMIMADQDQDGSHIKGLIINFIHHFWPSLIKNNSFMKEFITPLIKATKGTQVHSFFSSADFRRWAENVDLKKWKIKYYKGLGTSTDKEGKEYFEHINKHQINFKYQNNEDDQAIDLVFNKKKADDRKEWLRMFDPDVCVDHKEKNLRYLDFINQELISFSNSDNVRSIPSICDGLKPGQRKILYGCFKRNLKNEVKVAQLVGYIAEHSAYHHGEASLAQAIIAMAQNFVGSNNINLLMPIGQFGSRNLGGKEAASPRYIFTNLNKLTRSLFNENDDHLYKYLEDDGQSVEPQWYLPIIPFSLVNGADGIGTGWSTSVPSYSPRDLVDNIKRRLQGKEFEAMKPWFKGFTGEVVATGRGGFTTCGRYEIVDDNTIRILELPIQKWTREYKNFLETMLNPEEGEAEIEDIKEYHTSNSVDFVVRMAPGKLQSIMKNESIEKKFKLTNSISTSNMVLFDSNGKIKKYNDSNEILEEYYQLRMSFYGKRKDYLVSKLQRDLEILENKKRFVLSVISEEVRIRNVRKAQLVKDLVSKGFKMMKDMTKIKSTKKAEGNVEEPEKQENDIEDEDNVKASEYNYLLNMPLWSITYEKVEDLKKEFDKKSEELEILLATTTQQMYETDLEEFLNMYSEYEESESKENKSAKVKNTKTLFAKPSGASKPTKLKKKKSKVEDSENSEVDIFGDSEEEEFEAKPKKKEVKRKSTKEDGPSAPIEAEEAKVSSTPVLTKANSMPMPEPKEKKARKPRKTDNKENKVAEKAAIEKEEKKVEEKKPEAPKFDLNNSILKYLGPKIKPLLNTKPETKTESTGLSLLERLKLREQSGDLSTFNQTYSTFKSTNSINEVGLRDSTHSSNLNEDENSKRKADIKIGKRLIKKRKTEDDDDYMTEEEDEDDPFSLLKRFNSQPTYLADVTNNNDAVREKRATAGSRKLIMSDEEDNDASKNLSDDEDYLLPGVI